MTWGAILTAAVTLALFLILLEVLGRLLIELRHIRAQLADLYGLLDWRLPRRHVQVRERQEAQR